MVAAILVCAIAFNSQAQPANSSALSSQSQPHIAPTDTNLCPGGSPSFYDVPQGYFYGEAIQYMACKQIITGYQPNQCVGSGTPVPNSNFFKPESSVTRDEYSRIVVGTFHWRYPTSPPEPPSFTDIADDFVQINIEQAYYKGVISGYTPYLCGQYQATYPCFKPRKNIRRDEMTKLVGFAADYPTPTPTPSDPTPTPNQRYNDVAHDYWAYSLIDHATAIGAVTGFDNNNQPCTDMSNGSCYFVPGRDATRAQIAQAIFASANGPSNGMFDHCCLTYTPPPYHTPLPQDAADGQWEGTNNMTYALNGDPHLVDPFIPGGHMAGSYLGSDAFKADASDLEWIYPNWLFLYDTNSEWPNGQCTGCDHWVPSMVFHVVDNYGNENCSAGHYDSVFQSDFPSASGYIHSPCLLGRLSELRIYPLSVVSFVSDTPYYVSIIWHQDCCYTHKITADDYYLNIRTTDLSPARRDYLGKFCFDHSSNVVTWCAAP